MNSESANELSFNPVSTNEEPNEDALRIGLAGIASVTGDQSVLDHVSQDGHILQLGDRLLDLTELKNCFVFGGGKAVNAMAKGIENSAVGNHFADRLSGLVNIPGNIELGEVGENTPLPKASAGVRIHRSQVRPTGLNEPTQKAIESTRKMQNAIRKCEIDDLVIYLISGGGSALIIDPIDGVDLNDVVTVTRVLSQSGMPIDQLNVVRSAICNCKSGGLATLCPSAYQVGFVISDTMNNAIQAIASGPTANVNADLDGAIELLRSIDSDMEKAERASIDRVMKAIEFRAETIEKRIDFEPSVTNFIIANNATAVDAAGVRAVQLGYDYWLQSGKPQTETVDKTAHRMLDFTKQLLDGNIHSNCIIDGGEPTVVMHSEPGLGGRNQHLVLQYYSLLELNGLLGKFSDAKMSFASLATDGEDGNTVAAGAILNATMIKRLQSARESADEVLSRFDSHRLLKSVGAVIETGATNTNVCDLRILIKPSSP